MSSTDEIIAVYIENGNRVIGFKQVPRQVNTVFPRCAFCNNLMEVGDLTYLTLDFTSEEITGGIPYMRLCLPCFQEFEADPDKVLFEMKLDIL